MGSVTMLRPGSMVTRALAVVVPEDDKQRDYLQELRKRCNDLVEKPQNFPELYGDVHKARWPRRDIREDYAKIMAVECEHSDLVDRRVGWPRRDGSCWGVSLRTLSHKTGIGNADERSRDGRDFRGRRRLLRRLRRLHEAKYLEGRKQLHLFRPVAGNRRWKVPEKDAAGRPNRLAGRWNNEPTVRKIGMPFVKHVALDERCELERKDAKAWRAGRIDHFTDVRRRRARDREIKQRQRDKAREQRIYYVEEQRLLAAKTSRRTE